jgi:SAM-dependent methyltransferase
VVLDLGCGLGRLTRPLAERAARVVALDVSAEMLARARALNAHLGNVDWVQGDGRSLPDVTVDVVLSLVVFQHLPDPALALGYVHDLGGVLTPGGWAVLHVSNDPAVHERSPSTARRVAAAVGRAPKGQADPRWRGSAVDLDDLRAAAADGGLRVDAVAGAGSQWCFVRILRS